MSKQGIETGASPQAQMDNFARMIDLRACGEDRFTVAPTPRGGQRLFGGQVIAQALRAAELTVDGRMPHSLHAYFLRPGSEEVNVEYAVDRNLDGRTVSSRRVVASQAGKTLLTMAVSFHNGSQGYEHAAPMPEVLLPEHLPTEWEAVKGLEIAGEEAFRYQMQIRPFDVRVPESARKFEMRGEDDPFYFWFRAAGPIGEDLRAHRALLGYVSDYSLLTATSIRHGRAFFRKDSVGTSLDHALWLHEPETRVDDWILFITESPWAGHGRGLNFGRFFTRDGRHVATVAQEALAAPV